MSTTLATRTCYQFRPAMLDGVMERIRHPNRLQLPTPSQKESLKSGDKVKIAFLHDSELASSLNMPHEQLWVGIVAGANEETDEFLGIIFDAATFAQVQVGQIIAFTSRHVLAIKSK